MMFQTSKIVTTLALSLSPTLTSALFADEQNASPQHVATVAKKIHKNAKKHAKEALAEYAENLRTKSPQELSAIATEAANLDAAKTKASQVIEQAKDKVEDVLETAQDKLEDVVENEHVQTSLDHVPDEVEEAVVDAAEDLKEAVVEKTQEVRQKVRTKAKSSIFDCLKCCGGKKDKEADSSFLEINTDGDRFHEVAKKIGGADVAKKRLAAYAEKLRQNPEAAANTAAQAVDVSEHVQTAKDKLEDVVEAAKDKVEDVVETAKDKVEDVLENEHVQAALELVPDELEDAVVEKAGEVKAHVRAKAKSGAFDCLRCGCFTKKDRDEELDSL